MKHNKTQLTTKNVIQGKRTIIFIKITDISKPNTICIKDVDAPTDCIGSRNTSG
jgi:hypothetical protein